jgi:hypothetical protein
MHAAKVARLLPEYALACSLRLCKACESGGARRDWDRGIRRQRRRRRRRKLLVLDTVVTDDAVSTTPVSTTPSSCDTVVMQRCRVRLCVPHGGARHRARWCTQVRCRRPQRIMYGVIFGDGAIRLEMSTATYRARAALWQRSRGRAGQAHTLAAAHTRREQAVDGRTPLTLYLRLSWPARPARAARTASGTEEHVDVGMTAFPAHTP